MMVLDSKKYIWRLAYKHEIFILIFLPKALFKAFL